MRDGQAADGWIDGAHGLDFVDPCTKVMNKNIAFIS